MERKPFVDPKQGERLLEVMKDNHLSQKKLGDAVYCSQQAISKYISCQRKLPVDTAERIGTEFRVRPEWLLCMDDWKQESDEYYAAVIDRTWDADDKAKELLGAFGFCFKRTGEVRIIPKQFFAEDGEVITVEVEDRMDRNAYRILSGENEVGRCSISEYDSLMGSIADYAEGAIRDLINRKEQNNG